MYECNASSTDALDPESFMRSMSESPALLDINQNRNRYESLKNHASVCSFCGVGCPFTVETDSKGRARVYPLSSLGLCVKGRTSLETGGHSERSSRLAKRKLPDDRIRVPMIRGHDGQMHEVSWDDALDRAAWLFLHAREWVGPEAVAIYGNGQKTMEAIWLASLYKLVFKVQTLGANSEHCLTSAGAAHTLNFGNEASFTTNQFEELSLCDVAVLHGTNAYMTFPQAYEKLVRNTKAIKVVIDPTVSDTVTELQAVDPRTWHIRFRQGGDVLFNLAVARVILENNWHDEAYLASHVDNQSLEAFRALCFEDRCEPLEAARRIKLPNQNIDELARTIRRYAELIGRTRDGYRPKPAFVSSMGINQSTGSYGFSTNLNLLLLTGNVGREGAGSLRIAGQSNATSELMMGFNSRRLVFNLEPGNEEHREKLARLLDIPESNISRTEGTPVAQMSEDDRLYCFLFVGTQMTKNMPRVGHWSRRMGRSFNIVIDSFLADGVLEHADVLLPAFTYTERTGVIQRGDRTLQLQQQVTAPPPQAWSDSQILAKLAMKIAERLDDEDTAALNQLDAAVVRRTFGRYLDEQGQADPAVIFDHLVSVNRSLNLYSRLEDEAGTPISHEMLRKQAGRGVQWGGNDRYRSKGGSPAGFGQIDADALIKARLVRPPNDFIEKLEEPLTEGCLSLITGRGRPGRRAAKGRGRYNSGIKTLPVYGLDPPDHSVEIHPEEATVRALTEGEPVCMLGDHGFVVANVAFNDRIARGTLFMDFVPGEVNRLTDYVEADQFTHQSLIKRTPVQLQSLSGLEHSLWLQPDSSAFSIAVDILYAHWRDCYPQDSDWIDTQRAHPEKKLWLTAEQLQNDGKPSSLAEAMGAVTVFFQRYSSDDAYKSHSAHMLLNLAEMVRERFLYILLPLIRRLDYQSVLHPVLADLVGAVTVVDDDGQSSQLDLLSAHKSAVLEFKEEIVAIQLFIAIKHSLEILYGKGAKVKRSDLAFVSGVAIPCAGDVPAHFLGISPAELGSALLVHSRAIGSSSLMIIDRSQNRAVRVDVLTGVLPKDKELGRLRGVVINRKRQASGREHSRFFDRLGELIVGYVRVGARNFTSWGPVPLNWTEYHQRLSFSPAKNRDFRRHLVEQAISTELAESLIDLGVLDRDADAETLEKLKERQTDRVNLTLDQNLEQRNSSQSLYAGTLDERVERVVEKIIAPVLANDGGRLEIINLDHSRGELRVRFVGSCANCPYSLLSMEQIVVPSLMAIPGINSVRHRAKPKPNEISESIPVSRVIPLVNAAEVSKC
ncbi:MAG: molybdopterin-dependent oxidoreductase [Granulosicoccus sp.]|nr:molybdopterin-dependent oxidoreductase [Granulosicoccus sp.]